MVREIVDVKKKYPKDWEYYSKWSKEKLVLALLGNKHGLEKVIKEFSNYRKKHEEIIPAPMEMSCDICGRHPNVVITTQFGRFCQEHARYI